MQMQYKLDKGGALESALLRRYKQQAPQAVLRFAQQRSALMKIPRSRIQIPQQRSEILQVACNNVNHRALPFHQALHT